MSQYDAFFAGIILGWAVLLFRAWLESRVGFDLSTPNLLMPFGMGVLGFTIYNHDKYGKFIVW